MAINNADSEQGQAYFAQVDDGRGGLVKKDPWGGNLNVSASLTLNYIRFTAPNLIYRPIGVDPFKKGVV